MSRLVSFAFVVALTATVACGESDIVEVNVGGRMFKTLRATLSGTQLVGVEDAVFLDMDPDVFGEVLNLLRESGAYLLPTDTVRATRVLRSAHQLGVNLELLRKLALLPPETIQSRAEYVKSQKRMPVFLSSSSSAPSHEEQLLVGYYPDDPVGLVKDGSGRTHSTSPAVFVAHRPFVIGSKTTSYVWAGLDSSGSASVEDCEFSVWHRDGSGAMGMLVTGKTTKEKEGGVWAMLEFDRPVFVDKGDVVSVSLKCASAASATHAGEGRGVHVFEFGLSTSARALVHDALSPLFKE